MLEWAGNKSTAKAIKKAVVETENTSHESGNNKKQLMQKLNNDKVKYAGGLLFVILFAFIGVRLLTGSHAASPFVSLNADQGTLASGATKQTCTGASDGSCVQFGSAGGGGGGGTDQGKVRYELDSASYFDSFATTQYVPFIKSHVTLLKSYPPYDDAYDTLFGLPMVAYRDPYTQKIDLSTNRQTVVGWLNRDVAAGYSGIFVDDANFAGGNQNIGTHADLAQLFVDLRNAQPTAQIQMNAQYHDIWPIMQNPSNPDYGNVQTALKQINVMAKEFCVGPTSGINTASDYASFMKYVDTLHGMGIHMDMWADYNSAGIPQNQYCEANYFLNNDGLDFITGDNQTPTNWWPGFSVDLGPATSARTRSSTGVWSRTFTNGEVYTVEPGATTQTITPPAGSKDVNGNSVTSISLAPATGVVLTK